MAEAPYVSHADNRCSAAQLQGLTTALKVLRLNGWVIFECPGPHEEVNNLCNEFYGWFSVTPCRCGGGDRSATRASSVLLNSPTFCIH